MPLNMSYVTLAVSCLIGFILLVVTTCSAPTSESIYIFSINIPALGSDAEWPTVFRGGVLGTCNSRFGPIPDYPDRQWYCGQLYGYLVLIAQNGIALGTGQRPDEMSDFPAPAYEEVVGATLSRAMVISPIAAALAGLGMLVCAVAMFLGKAAIWSALCAGLTGVAAILAWVAFGINLAVAFKVKNAVDDTDSPAESVDVGAAAYLPLGAAIAMTGGLLLWILQTLRAQSKQRRASRGNGAGSPSTLVDSREAGRKTEMS